METEATHPIDEPKTSPPAEEEAPATDEPTSPVDRLEESVESLRRLVTDELARDRFRETQVERLHAELQEHKRGLLDQALRPFLTGVVRIHVDLERTVEGLRAREDLTVETLLGVLEGFGDDLLLFLDDRGAQPFEHPGEGFCPERQTALGTADTEDEALVGHIARRVRPGFEYGDLLLQKERVVVYRAAPSDHPEEIQS